MEKIKIPVPARTITLIIQPVDKGLTLYRSTRAFEGVKLKHKVGNKRR
jgi:hypothetical protein